MVHIRADYEHFKSINEFCIRLHSLNTFEISIENQSLCPILNGGVIRFDGVINIKSATVNVQYGRQSDNKFTINVSNGRELN